MGKMIKWIIENKQWIFSGIGVSALAGLYFLVRWLFKRKAPPATIVTPQSRKEDAKGEIAQAVPQTQNPESETENLRPITKLDFDDIQNTIKALPPFQEAKIFRDYIGLRVEFMGQLYHAELQDKDTIKFALNGPKPGTLVFCVVGENEYPEIKIMHKGTIVTVQGTINNISTYSATLNQVVITNYKPKG